MSFQGDIAIQNALNEIWGTYNKFMVDSFPSHYFAHKHLFTYNKPIYVLAFSCTNYSEPFNIYLEIMDMWDTPDKPEVHLSAYCPSFVTNNTSYQYERLKRMVNAVNTDPHFDVEYDFKLDTGLYGDQVGCSLYAVCHYHNNLVPLIRSFYDEAKFIYGYMVDNF